MRRGKLRRSLSMNSSLDIRNHVIEFVAKESAAEQPEFRWDQFDRVKNNKQPIDVVSDEEDDDDDIVPTKPLNKKVTRTTSRGSGGSGRIPKPGMITRASRATSAPVPQQQSSGATFFSWDQYQRKGSTHSSSSPASSAMRPRSPTPSRSLERAQSVSILKQSRYPVTPPASGNDNGEAEVFCWENYQPTRNSTGSKNLLARGRALMQRDEESKSIMADDDHADDSLNDGCSEHSSVSFRNSIKIFEIPKYCDKKIKQDFFYTKSEIKTFKAEKKEEKRERKLKRQARSLSPPRRTTSAPSL